MAKAKLFKNGSSQAVRLPKEFRFEGDVVYVKKMGNAVVLFPQEDSWDLLFTAFDQFPSDVFTDGREQLPTDKRIPLDI